MVSKTFNNDDMRAFAGIYIYGLGKNIMWNV